MPRIYKISRAGLKIIYKMRHHKGHGIHSPFVFNLITKVIEEKISYYAYHDIKQYIKLHKNIYHKPSKINRLSFRLVNYFDAKRILEIGSGNGINSLYLSSPSTQTECACVEYSPEKSALAKELYKDWERNITLSTDKIPHLTEKQDCIYINLKNYKNLSDNELEILLNLVHSKTFIIVEGLRTNKAYRALWKRLSGIESRTAALDLFSLGIIFFDPTLYRWDYKISF